MEETTSTVTKTVQPLPGGGAVETVERVDTYPEREPMAMPEPAPAVDLAPIHAMLTLLSEQLADVRAEMASIRATPPVVVEPEPAEEEPEEVIEVEEETEATETVVKPNPEVTPAPAKKKMAGWLI